VKVKGRKREGKGAGKVEGTRKVRKGRGGKEGGKRRELVPFNFCCVVAP